MKFLLKDHEELAIKLAKERFEKRIMSDVPCHFQLVHVLESLRQYVKGNLSYNDTTGKTTFQGSAVGSYTRKEDIQKYDNIMDLIVYEFLNHIFSSANRLSMGYKTV